MHPLPPTSAARRPLRLALLALLFLSFLPALLLALSRIRYEQASRTVTVVMDYQALRVQARQLGRDWRALLAEYRKVGVNGVSVDEDVVQDLLTRGQAVFKSGSQFLADDASAPVHPDWSYLRSLTPGAVEALRGRYTYKSELTRVNGKTWIGWAVNILGAPAGPNTPLISYLQRQGYQVVYRPFDSRAVPAQKVALDWPRVPFIAFNGLSVVDGNDPARLAEVDARLGSRVPAVIELGDNVRQAGIDELVKDHPAIRMFAIRQEWQDLLRPDEVASKFVLAARERSHRILYVRPFPTEADTKTFLSEVSAGLKKAGLTVGHPVVSAYQPNNLLRALSLLGPLAALGLLALSYPLTRLGLLVGLGTLGLVLVVNSSAPFAAGALLAAVTFPALGFVMRRSRPTDWLIATAFSFMGVLFVAALGSERLSMLGLEPFRGVGLTLLVPLALFALSLLPRQDVRKTFIDLYNVPLKLGDIAIILLGVAAIGLIVLRRGNTPAVGVSDAEAKARQALQDAIIRPRFKELVGHPLAILGLSGKFPPYLAYLLLLAGVVGQASILNTFSHFHTPLLISLQRMFNGVVIGGVIGFLLLPLLTWGLRFAGFGGRAERTAKPRGGQRA